MLRPRPAIIGSYFNRSFRQLKLKRINAENLRFGCEITQSLSYVDRPCSL